MTDEEVRYILDAIRKVCMHHADWMKDYIYLSKKNEYIHKDHVERLPEEKLMSGWFKL